MISRGYALDYFPMALAILDGRLWEASPPGHTPLSPLRLDPAIPPVFATEPSCWFLPEGFPAVDGNGETGR